MPRVRQKTKRGSRPVRPQTEKHRGGRPSKYSLAVVARICKFVREGCSREAAASLTGISVATLYDWQRRFPEFSEALQKADSQFERACVGSIRKAGRKPRNWPANAWLLERKFPQRYGKIDRHLIHAERNGGPLPAAFVAAIQRALGFTGKLTPIIGPATAGLVASGAEGENSDPDILPN